MPASRLWAGELLEKAESVAAISSLRFLRMFDSTTHFLSHWFPVCIFLNAYVILSQTRDFSTSMGFPGGSVDKESTCNVGDLGLISGLGRSSGEGIRYTRQSSGLENSMDCIVHGVSKSWT